MFFFQSRSQEMFTQLLERKPREPWNTDGGIGGTSGAQGQRVKDKASVAAPILFKLDGLGTKIVSFSIFTAVNSSFCRTCCWLMCSPFVLGEFPLIIRCFLPKNKTLFG